MIIERYIIKLFSQKLLSTILICAIASFLVDGVGNVSRCLGTCSLSAAILTSVYSSILFIDNAIFFIVAISTVWFTISLSRTNQFVIITLYSKKNTIFVKSVVICVISFSVIYLTIFSSILIPSMKNYISQNENHSSSNIEKIWINALKVNDGIVSGNIYFIKNVESYLSGYRSDLISIYTISGGYLTSYQKFNRPFLTSSENGFLMFLFRGDDGKTKRKIAKDTSVNDIKKEFKKNGEQGSVGLAEGIVVATSNRGYSYNDKADAKVVILKSLEKIIGFFTAMMIVFSEFPMYHQRVGGDIRYGMLRVISFCMTSYTIPEILKIVNNYGNAGYVASFTCALAILCIFFSRFVKHHN